MNAWFVDRNALIAATPSFYACPIRREELNKVMQKIRMDKLKDRKGLERKIAQQGGALSQVEMGNAKSWK